MSTATEVSTTAPSTPSRSLPSWSACPYPTLRLYEDKGLVQPQRTEGGTRRYSDADLARIARVSELVESGVTLAAVAMVLDLQDDNADLATRNRRLRERNATLRQDNDRLRDGSDARATDTDTDT